MSNDFFSQIAHQLYTYNYKINGTDFFNYRDYIEAKHEQAEFKGVSFYRNLIHAMPQYGGRIADINKGEAPSHQEKIFTEVLNYCKTKIVGPNTSAQSNDQKNEFQVPWQQLIKKELHTRLNEVEAKIGNKIANWRQRIDLIECAAFCQLLFDKKYFVNESTKIVSVNSFALSKYGTDIKVQLASAKKADREKHKSLLEKNFR